MSPQLKPLLLPQLVEERRRRESLQGPDADPSSSFYTMNSSVSDFPSPVTPTFSHRGHTRYPSSASSMDLATPAADSPSSPTFNGLKSSNKRSLPDVKEEPLEKEEQESDFDMVDSDDEDCFCYDRQASALAHSATQLPTSESDVDYDLIDCFFSDGEIDLESKFKKQTIATRFGTRFPSFKGKWQSRSCKGPNAPAIWDEQREGAASRAASSRSSSVSNSVRHFSGSQLPPTPTRSIYDGGDENEVSYRIDTDKANRCSEEPQEQSAKTPRTPLLPPLLMDPAAGDRQILIKSPLQSPTVADPGERHSFSTTPIDHASTPQLPGVPSPPLSNKASIASMHRNRPPHLIPSSDIPGLLIADENDEWANKLGHANFTIEPEPYVPEVCDLLALRQLRQDWELARTNYMKHLVRTGEHYGVTSKTYKLTEEKWATIDAEWRRNNDLTIQNTVENSKSGNVIMTLTEHHIGEPNPSNVMTRIPSLNSPSCQGKFPQLGDESIVGPMVRLPQRLHRTPSKKAKLFKFFAEKFPAGLGRSVSS